MAFAHGLDSIKNSTVNALGTVRLHFEHRGEAPTEFTTRMRGYLEHAPGFIYRISSRDAHLDAFAPNGTRADVVDICALDAAQHVSGHAQIQLKVSELCAESALTVVYDGRPAAGASCEDIKMAPTWSLQAQGLLATRGPSTSVYPAESMGAVALQSAKIALARALECASVLKVCWFNPAHEVFRVMLYAGAQLRAYLAMCSLERSACPVQVAELGPGDHHISAMLTPPGLEPNVWLDQVQSAAWSMRNFTILKFSQRNGTLTGDFDSPHEAAAWGKEVDGSFLMIHDSMSTVLWALERGAHKVKFDIQPVQAAVDEVFEVDQKFSNTVINKPASVLAPDLLHLVFGTRYADYDACYVAVAMAIKTGYRQFDTSESWYANTGNCVSDAILDSRKPRDEFLVTGRLETDEFKSVDEWEEFILKEVQKWTAHGRLGHFDIYLVGGDGHASLPYQSDFAYQALERIIMRDTGGVIKALGSGNTHWMKFVQLMTKARVHPVYWQRQCTVYTCVDYGVLNVLENYPNIIFAGYGLLNPKIEFLDPHQEPIVRSLARKHSCSTNQLLLAWARRKSVAVVVSSTNHERIIENFKAYDSPTVRLTDYDIAYLDSLQRLYELPDVTITDEGWSSYAWAQLDSEVFESII